MYYAQYKIDFFLKNNRLIIFFYGILKKIGGKKITTLINGDIYIKIKPSIFNPTNEQQQEVEDKIYDIDFEEAHRGANQGTQEIKKTLNSMKEIFSKKGELDYSYIDDFHVLETDGENATMIMFERMLKKAITDSFSIESKKCQNI